MFARVLGWLRPSGDPVVEQSAPEPAVHGGAFAAREAEIAAINRAIAWEFERGDMVAVDALLDERNKLRAGRPKARPSVPAAPGRTS